jgi:triacylglycerol esterase/lipase EstA (alpha/beta hydrolase family)
MLAVRLPAGPSVPPVEQSAPGPVLLVPGYGGSTGSLEVLATALRAAGRAATVVALPGDGTGDLRASAAALDAAVRATGAASVDLIGYSAGGVSVRLWVADNPGRVRRVVTLGSPHHGTKVAAVAAVLAPGACPPACRQLVPGSQLLERLNDGDETPDGPQWLALWTSQDETVTPPDSARLDGAVNVALQDVCAGISVAHSALPTAPLVQGLVLQALSTRDIAPPSPADCPALSRGSLSS